MKKILVLVTLLAMVFAVSIAFASNQQVIIQAEDYAREEGGKAEGIVGRLGATNLLLAYWDKQGHAIEWDVEIPETGLYKVVIRYCQNRRFDVYRDFQIDGKYPHPAFEKIVFADTGGWSKSSNDFVNLVDSDAEGKPVLIELTKGKHVVRMNNIGAASDAANPSINLDAFAFLGKDVDPSVVGP